MAMATYGGKCSVRLMVPEGSSQNGAARAWQEEQLRACMSQTTVLRALLGVSKACGNLKAHSQCLPPQQGHAL